MLHDTMKRIQLFQPHLLKSIHSVMWRVASLLQTFYPAIVSCSHLLIEQNNLQLLIHFAQRRIAARQLSPCNVRSCIALPWPNNDLFKQHKSFCLCAFLTGQHCDKMSFLMELIIYRKIKCRNTQKSSQQSNLMRFKICSWRSGTEWNTTSGSKWHNWKHHGTGNDGKRLFISKKIH